MRLLTAITLSLLALSGALQASDRELLNAEQQDARLREQQELEDRTRELEAQRQTTQQLLDQQDAYLKALREQINALKDTGAEENNNIEPADSARETP
ncbi:hypothetical protein [Alcanivorax sp. DP30]|uniref:hypothetical protein n=1 Tax=Alcanivorax sp. DP30 TaxID=2606217 RepID=UPI001368CB1A|nr:hypothetical protein [Alcanivorax sp. DP30]MZR62351.1 hypothetical protein [Alcanivorax sp. DP30]